MVVINQQATNSVQRQHASLAIANDPGKALQLAANFQPDVDMLVADGLLAFGIKGSGKSSLLARVSEQLGRFFLPQIILDTEREYHSLVNLLPHGIIATANRCPSGYDILHRGLQVVLDLRSWETDEAAALAIVQLVNELFTVTMAQAPQDRVPCVIHLDEAAYWIPQEPVPYLSKGTRQAMTDAFHRLASRGRKLGLVPFLYTQSISEVGKQSIRQAGIKILMRQTLDVDLNRYAEYIRNCTPARKKAIQTFTAGKAIVILPDGSQCVVQFYPRQSTHTSHTPRTQAALSKFATTSVDLAALPMRDLTAASASAQVEPPMQRRRGRKAGEPKEHPQVQAGKPKHAPLIRERVFTLLQLNPEYTSRQLAALVGCPQNTAQIARKDYFRDLPAKQSKVEQRIRELLVENPGYTLSQLARRANCCYADAKKWVERIESK
jgi:hypothetical protein